MEPSQSQSGAFPFSPSHELTAFSPLKPQSPIPFLSSGLSGCLWLSLIPLWGSYRDVHNWCCFYIPPINLFFVTGGKSKFIQEPRRVRGKLFFLPLQWLRWWLELTFNPRVLSSWLSALRRMWLLYVPNYSYNWTWEFWKSCKWIILLSS